VKSLVKVGIYTRVSTKDQAQDGYSLSAQRERLIAYCKAQNWQIYKIYQDDGYTGRKTKRPAYQKMINDRDKWDMILVMKMDRIHRNSRNFMEMMDNLRKWGKEFSSMQESLDTSTAMGRFVVDIIQRIAQLESEQIGERVYAGMKQKAKTVGGPMGKNTPFGYEYQDGKYKLNEDESEVVRLIFAKYIVGKTTQQIADELNSMEIVTKNNNKWKKQSISWILRNPIYCGFNYWDGILERAEHPLIINASVFNDVQLRLLERIKYVPSGYESLIIPETAE
jgi:DNA invertase Pin-like site-specific DNA recombinase